MNRYVLTIAVLFASIIVSAQSIKNSFGENAAVNEKTLSVKAEVAKREPDWRYGFDVDFEFTVGLEAKQRTSWMAQIDKITVHKEKGYFYQGYNDKTGKYHPCSKLNNLCDGADLNAVIIRAVWEFNGKEFKTGALNFSNRRDDKSYVKKPISVSPPGGSGITPDDVKSGAAKLVNIEMASWSFLNTDEIMNIIRAMK